MSRVSAVRDIHTPFCTRVMHSLFISVHLLQNKIVERIASGPQNLLDTLKRLTDLVGEASAYVASVVVSVNR